MTPKANGCIPSCSTRYIGSTLATISDEMSVKRLVRPSAHTVPLTDGSSFDVFARGAECGHPAQAEQLRWVRVIRLVQSMAYIFEIGSSGCRLQTQRDG